MKRILLLMAIFMVTVTGVSAKGGPTFLPPSKSVQDTIVVKMANGAKMILHLENMQQLKAFERYSLDSLMRELNAYVKRVDQMEASGKEAKEMTVTFNKDKSADGKPEQVTITVQEQAPQGQQKTTERHEIRSNKNFKIDVQVEEKEDGNTRVRVDMPTQAERDSARTVRRAKCYKATRFNLNVDLGLNNFINAGGEAFVPDLKPTDSRYVSLNLHLNSQIGGRKSPFYLISGFEFAFNNYMFDDNVVVEDLGNITQFRRVADINFKKSKLTHSSVNIPLMPMLRFKHENGKDGFKIGAGGFAGYRLGSHTKLKYEANGKIEKDKPRDNFNLSDFQYGLEGVVGYGGLDLFVKYNMNDLFKENRGPQVNVISFGLRLIN